MSFKNIIAIVGMPRSGTSWLAQIIDSSKNVAYRLDPIFSYAFKNTVDETSSKEEYERLFAAIYASNDDFLLQKDKRNKGVYPTFEKYDNPEFLAFKTTRFHHLSEKMLTFFDNLRMISIVRHPCGAINSWITTPREFPATADPMKEWRSGSCRKTSIEEFWGFNDWKKVTTMHLNLRNRYPEQFRIVKYEDLVENTTEKTEEIFDFLGLKVESQTTDFICSCHRRHDDDSYSVFKKKDVVDAWNSKLSPIIIDEIISDISGTELEIFL